MSLYEMTGYLRDELVIEVPFTLIVYVGFSTLTYPLGTVSTGVAADLVLEVDPPDDVDDELLPEEDPPL